jgi:hypothetical protein
MDESVQMAKMLAHGFTREPTIQPNVVMDAPTQSHDDGILGIELDQTTHHAIEEVQ